jgi:tetratricopeptide (TPR) repeat protein
MHYAMPRTALILHITNAFLLVFMTQKSFAAPRPEDYLARGDERFLAGDNWMALRAYEAAYHSRPTGYQEILRMVRVYNDLGRVTLRHSDSSEFYYKQATMYAESLQYYHPDIAETHFMYALSYGSLLPFCGVQEKIRIGKIVRDHAHRALELDSSFAMTYVLLGIFEREGANLSWIERGFVRIVFGEEIGGSLKQSEAYLLSAIRYDPDNSFAHYELYWTYKASGDSERALASLRRVLASQPHTAREISQFEEAREEISKLVPVRR